MTDSRALCGAITKSGDRCRTPARPGRSLCWVHDPELDARRRAGHALGGRNNRKREPVALEAVKLETADDARTVLQRALSEAFALEGSPQKVRAIVGLVEAFLGLLASEELARKLGKAGDDEVWRIRLRIPPPSEDGGCLPH
jgi:HEAT repeat protein